MDLTLDTTTPRSSSPESSATTTSSFFRASNTVDDLTRALASFTRGATPEPALEIALCCCERENCDATLVWLQAKEKLEKKLELSAEIGQALLERHEAYVRRHDKMVASHEKEQKNLEEQVLSLRESNSTLVARMAELIRESAQMEKRLTQADLNLQVADASNRTLLNELQDTRTAITRMAAQNARSVGWETRLANAMQERDDIAQEKEAERQRSRTAEAKAAAADAKYSELQAEVLRLRDELEQAHASRSDLSAILIQDARARLEGLQNSLGLHEQPDAEVTRILESVVAENEAIKRDNAELQNMLTESREELRLARDELAELQATATLAPSPIPPTPSPRANTPASFQVPTHARRQSSSKGGSGWVPPATALISTKGHRSVDSWASNGPLSPYSRHVSSPLFSSTGYPWRRGSENVTMPKRSRSIDSTSGHRRSTAGDRSPVPPESVTSPSVEYSILSGDGPDDTVWTANPVDASPQKPRARPRTLMLLSRNKGVQTDGTEAEYTDSSVPRGPAQPLVNTQRLPHLDPKAITRPQYSPKTSSISDSFGFTTPLQKSTNSETSSLEFNFPANTISDPRLAPGASVSATLPGLIDRVVALHTKISQADVRTLHNRLKRQHIVGGDVGHLSKSTLKSIMVEINGLRGHFKPALDAAGLTSPSLGNGDEPPSLVNRTDLRALLKATKDLLVELIQLRSTLNTVTLDPLSATRLKEQAFSDAPRSGTVTPDGEEERGRSAAKLLRPPAAMGWIAAPIQKLFSGSNASSNDVTNTEAGPSKRGRADFTPQTVRAPKLAPKLAPAIAATTATVNVEFGSTGMRRATVDEGTNETIDATFTAMSRTNSENMTGGSLGRASAARLGLGLAANKTPPIVADEAERSRNLLGIFAGAPTASSSRKDGWVVLPNRSKTDRRPGSTAASLATDAPIHSYRAMRGAGLDGPGFGAQRRLGIGNTGGIGANVRATSGFNPNRLSRIVDAVIDDNASIAPSELERSLRGRNLSDSSIHSSFVRQGPVQRLLTPAAVALSAPTVDTATPTPSSTEPSTFVDRESVLQSLSRKVQSFVQSGVESTPAASQPTLPPGSPQQPSQSSRAPKSSLGENFGPTSASPSASSPPKPIPSRNPRGHARSSSRSGHRRDGSPSGRMLSFVQSVGSWVQPNAEALMGTPSASFRDGSPLAAQSRLRKESRGGTDF